ncbi:MAG TPA: thermonuclease family protein [Alphaproteobacteria bacterium]|nr:thermonuclease family protein [Alphaproteobacteria bacterium]
MPPFRIVVLAAAILAGPACADETAAGRATVIDGDTIAIRDQRFRLHGIDAPEGDQLCQDAQGRDWRCGQRAALALADRIGQRTVACEPRDLDRYGRIVAVCRTGNDDLNAWMVAHGWAVAYREYSTDYAGAEASARAARAGIWAGTFQDPAAYRRGRRAVAAPANENTASPGACRIKGNIARDGERIYHVPGGRWYDPTGIDTGRGERWFCSEAEAQAAGWRRSGQ